jgi:2-(1,2-epoxy-1,2-dihydrophenyl)acetyl-CoA isomerase
MSDDHILLERLGRVALITLNRPERLNAMSDQMMTGALKYLEELSHDRDVGCVVLTGAGRGFCAGGDVKGMAERNEARGNGAADDRPREDPVARLRRSEQVSWLLHEMPKPTIAMVNGPAAGAGLSLACACDLRFAGESARFGTAFARVGFSGDFGGTYSLQLLVGQAKAKELYFTAEVIDAQEASRIGLVNRLYPDDELREKTLAFAEKLAAGPPLALALMKENLNRAPEGRFTDILDREARDMTRTGMTRDHREAAIAFVEKREPVFTGN